MENTAYTDRPPALLIVATHVMASLLGASVVLLAFSARDEGVSPPRDPHFVRVGRAYLPQLGRVYAAAWEDGAKSLEAGAPPSAAIAEVGRRWESGRATLFDRALTPEFAPIVPEAQKDADVTPQQRAAMVAAWRGLAAGLGK